MTATELRDRLNTLGLPGAFTAHGTEVRWRFRAEGLPTSVEAREQIWDVLCEVRARLEQELPTGWRRRSGWADADAAGFDVAAADER